ncbi:MAG TPA: hypothetical protein VMF89_29370, partial [Polyangiales bacterium]|nr:hypothetical protein [Polyangiales bacterium]
MSKVGTHADLRTLTPATMQRWADDLGLTALPDFGEAPRRAEPCKPEELFRCLLELEDHVHYLEPAFAFALGALGAAELPTLRASVDAEGLVETLGAWARECAPRYASPLDPELAVVVAKEYGPAGLTDGAWLHGAMLANAVESEVGMRLLKQLMLRFAGPGVGEAYTQRYAALLRSAGILPASVLRRGHCLEISYEHALLGLCLGLFPTTFAAETVGFNLWMSAVGPCPLLELLADSLRTQGVNTRYLELHDRTSMAELAKQAVHFTLQDAQDDGARVRLAARIARGFCAAQRSYQRWARAMSGEEIDLDGVYAAPHELDSLVEQAFMCFGGLGEKELYHRLANADLFPAVRLFAREFVELAFARLAQVFRADPRLNSQQVPSYSERTIAEIVAAQHDKNVRSRGQPNTSLASSNSEEAINGIQEVFDGSWLQGFVDVLRADLEEYGWLFRIYASE